MKEWIVLWRRGSQARQPIFRVKSHESCHTPIFLTIQLKNTDRSSGNIPLGLVPLPRVYGHEAQTATIATAERETDGVQKGLCVNAHPQGAQDCDDQLVCVEHLSVIKVASAHDQGRKEGASCVRDRDGSDVEMVTIEAVQQGESERMHMLQESETMHMLQPLPHPTNCSGQGDKRVGEKDKEEEEEDEWRNMNGVATGILLLCLALLYFIFR